MEEAREMFWTNIAASINEAKICQSGGNNDSKEIQMYQEYMAIEMKGRLMVREVRKIERNSRSKAI